MNTMRFIFVLLVQLCVSSATSDTPIPLPRAANGPPPPRPIATMTTTGVKPPPPRPQPRTFFMPQTSSPYTSPPAHTLTANDQVAIVTMTRKPHHLATWVNHHIERLKIARIYIYFDAIHSLHEYFYNQVNSIKPLHRSKVIVFEITPQWKKLHGYTIDPSRDRSSENRYLQQICVNDAIDFAVIEKMDWIFHIDTDEIIHLAHNHTLPAYLSYINNADKINMTFAVPNWEGLINTPHYENCFDQVKWFRTANNHFIAYGNGKGFARVHPLLRHFGVHRLLWNNTHRQVFLSEREMVILHYPCCNLEEFVAKYRNLGKFPNKGWEWTQLHLNARDQMAVCRENATSISGSSSSPVATTPTARTNDGKAFSLTDPPSQCEIRVAEEIFRRRGTLGTDEKNSTLRHVEQL